VAPVKLTKNAMRTEQLRLTQLLRYLPTLQLKKAMLQTEVMHAAFEVKNLKKELSQKKEEAFEYASLLADRGSIQMVNTIEIEQVEKTFESIAGVEIPVFQSVVFGQKSYSLFDTPLWFDDARSSLQSILEEEEKLTIAKQRLLLLEKELREVSIRVNLFEKIMIPRTQANIKKIRVFLGDQELAAVAQAKIAKTKIEKKKQKKKQLAVA